MKTQCPNTDHAYGRDRLDCLNSQLETPFQLAVEQMAHTLGWTLRYHSHDSRRDPEGFPDLVLVNEAAGRIIYVECKRITGIRTPAQVRWGDALLMAGQSYYCFRPCDWDEIEAVLRSGAPERTGS